MVTVGYKFGGVLAQNGSLLWNSVPLELVEFYRVNNMRMGIGAAYHTGNKLKYDDVPGVGTLNVNFDDALGGVVQIGWAPTNGRYTVDLRYTDIKYRVLGS